MLIVYNLSPLKNSAKSAREVSALYLSMRPLRRGAEVGKIYITYKIKHQSIIRTLFITQKYNNYKSNNYCNP